MSVDPSSNGGDGESMISNLFGGAQIAPSIQVVEGTVLKEEVSPMEQITEGATNTQTVTKQ